MLLRSRLLGLVSIATIFVLIFSLSHTVTVSADDTVPPVSTEEPVATDEPVATQEPVSTEEPVATQEPAATDVSEPNAEDKTIVEILQQLPDDTAVVVLDKSGQPEPFVTEEVVNVIAVGDPYFWDGAQFVGYTTSTCPVIVTVCNVVPSSPIQNAIDAYSTTASATGNIYIEAGMYDEDVIIDGSEGYLSNLTGLIGAGSDSTTISGYVSIMNMTNAFTASGFTVTEYIVFTDGTNNAIFSDLVINSDGSNTEDGMYVQTAGNVTITDVLSNDNPGNGAYIDAGGNVEIANSTFSNNGWSLAYDNYTPTLMSYSSGSGLNVYSTGDITLSDLMANGNANYGAYLSAPSGDISIDNSQFNENGGLGNAYISNDGDSLYAEFSGSDGISIDGANNVTLSNVEADHNSNNGAFITADGNIGITDSSFNDNGWDAEIFHCDGYCAYDYLYEYFVDGYCVDNDGFYDGTFFNPCDDFDYVNVNAPNFNFYVENGDNSGYYSMSEYSGQGLFAETLSGDIGLQNVEASFNGGDGAYLGTSNGNIFVTDSYFEGNGELGYLDFEECSSADASCLFSNDPVDFAYSGSLYFNYGSGLIADATLGDITLNQVEASDNFDGGASLWTDSVDGGSILVEESDFTDNGYSPVSINGVGGMFVESLSDEFALDSLLESPTGELYISTAAASYSGSENSAAFGGLDSGSGLEVADAGGDITLTNVTAADNGGYGANLVTSADATISDSVFTGNGYGYESVFYVSTYDDFASFSEYGSGMAIDSSGATSLRYNTASGNYADGATITASTIDVICGSYTENSGYGINALYGASLTLRDVVFAPANGSGDYFYPGSPNSISDNCYPVGSEGKKVQENSPGSVLPWNVVHVESETVQNVALDCKNYRGTILVLPNDDRVSYPCLLEDSGSLQAKTITEIPALPEDSHFLSSLLVQLFRENKEQRLAEPNITVSFAIPEGTNVDDLAILYWNWNASKWVKLENSVDQHKDDGYYFEGTSNMIGIFALISWQE